MRHWQHLKTVRKKHLYHCRISPWQNPETPGTCTPCCVARDVCLLFIRHSWRSDTCSTSRSCLSAPRFRVRTQSTSVSYVFEQICRCSRYKMTSSNPRISTFSNPSNLLWRLLLKVPAAFFWFTGKGRTSEKITFYGADRSRLKQIEAVCSSTHDNSSGRLFTYKADPVRGRRKALRHRLLCKRSLSIIHV